METFYIHNAIRNLYPNVITIRDNESFDENDNIVNINMDAVMVEADRLSHIKPVTIEDTIEDLKKQIQELKQLVK